MKQAAVFLLAYLLGCITLGPILARLKGVDLRSVGSGNIGATNVLRALGRTAAVATLLGDALKGSAAVFLGMALLDRPIDAGLAGLCAILGHNFPVFLGFRGGKGVATSLGVLAVYLPVVALGFAGIWLLVFALTRISSLSALCGFAGASVIAYTSYPEHGFVVLAMTLLAVVLHRQNVIRLFRGEESRFGIKVGGGPR